MASVTAYVTTDTDTGSIYYVMTQSPSQPSESQIIAGQDHLGATADASGIIVVTSTGQKSETVPGLAESTQYYTYFVHSNLGVLSNIANAPAVTT